MAKRKKRTAGASTGVPLPSGFAERMKHRLGAEAPDLLASLDTPAPVSIRLNQRKPFPLDAAPVPWCAAGRYLDVRPSFTLDPLLHAGAYYVQEASSMLLEQAVAASGMADTEVLALDLCAAPGGKSTHLLNLLSPGSLLVANEVVSARRTILAENIWKSGATNAVITGSDPADLQRMPEAFDLILVDAPCSGEGLFRRDMYARQQWSPRLVEQCAARQSRILEQAWGALAPGGCLIYSTCTWEHAENEAQAARLVQFGALPQELPITPGWGVERVEHEGTVGYMCLPHRVRGEGFFLCMLRKPGEHSLTVRPSAEAEQQQAVHWLKSDAGLDLHEHDKVLHARPARWSRTIDGLGLRVAHPGVPSAEAKAGAWIPHFAAALSTALRMEGMHALDLDRDAALDFLRGAALPASDAHGPALVRHRGFGLGWAQGAGGRWNNRWPSAWRVRQAASEAPPVSWAVP